jgi:Sec-independent protein secretion pathway component TatC
LEFFPLLFLFEFSIWLASFMEKRWDLVDEPSRWAIE